MPLLSEPVSYPGFPAGVAVVSVGLGAEYVVAVSGATNGFARPLPDAGSGSTPSSTRLWHLAAAIFYKFASRRKLETRRCTAKDAASHADIVQVTNQRRHQAWNTHLIDEVLTRPDPAVLRDGLVVVRRYGAARLHSPRHG